MTDVLPVCFSVVNVASFQNVKEEWVTELKEYTLNIPVVLIGTQISEVTPKLYPSGIEVFGEAITAILTPKKHTVKKKIGSRCINCCLIT
uniref:Uncharacterized protein n=1 Tax=Phocoena sinus TaxID=42100 RepID=A0A8C9CRN0_PHOSS